MLAIDPVLGGLEIALFVVLSALVLLVAYIGRKAK